MANRGTLYDWRDPAVVAKNGRGRAVQAGYPLLNWGWDWLTATEWNWWVTTVLGGSIDALLTGTTQLYDNQAVLQDIDSCIVVKPVHETIVNGVHRNVRILIHQIVLA